MRVDGASTARIATTLFLPLSASTLVAVGILTLLQVLNDSLIMAVMTNGPSFYTLPILVANGLGGMGALGASWLSIGPPLIIFLTFQRHFRRGIVAGQLLWSRRDRRRAGGGRPSWLASCRSSRDMAASR